MLESIVEACCKSSSQGDDMSNESLKEGSEFLFVLVGPSEDNIEHVLINLLPIDSYVASFGKESH